ncbi:hypothetical protein LAZ67_6000035, partial [Cordylochernes scorpioides]
MALLLEIKNENWVKVKELLESGADINIKTKRGNSPLHLSARKGHQDLVQYLVEAGADVNSLNGYRQSPLHYAILGHELSIASYLIDEGADVNIKDIGNWVPLLYAITYWVQSADINARDNAGDTVLSLAINYGNYKIISLLVGAGIQVDVEYKDCFNIITLAALKAMWCEITVLKIILRAAHDIDLVQLLQYSPGADINARDNAVEAGIQVDVEYKDCFNIITLAALKATWYETTILKIILRAAHDIDLVQLLQYSP